MPRPNWYNDNINRAFPFEYKTVGVAVPESALPTMKQLPDDFIADCGFTIGPAADFNSLYDDFGVEKPPNSVYLSKVSRVGDTVFFEFVTDEKSMATFPLVFSRDISDEEYTLEYLDSDSPVRRQDSLSDSVGSLCREPFWSGYLVTGDMSSIAARLSDGASISRLAGDAIVEPALVENLSNSIVNSFELANTDRTRATSPGACDPIEWEFPTDLTYEAARCIQGEVKMKAGYNVRISVNQNANLITLSAVVGAGEGHPCDEVSLFPGETPPIGAENNLFEGGPLCNETIRAINGIAGPDLRVIGGQGVSVNPDLENNCIDIDVNFLGLDLCAFSFTSESL